jgi:hypothetical protein
MQKRNFFSLIEVVSILLISLLLQNCGGSFSLPIEGEEEPAESIKQTVQGRRKRARIEIEQGEGQRLIEQ